MRDSIILYRSLREATKMLDLETRAKVYDSVMDYAFDGIEPNETGVVMAMFLMMKPIIDANNQRYENGCKGGRPKNQNKTEIKPNNNQNETKVEPNKDKDKDVDKDKEEKESVKKKVATAPTFKKPTLDEIKAYCEERGNRVDAERWLDYYTANGWKVGRNPMKDWKATVRTWEKGEQRKPIENVNTHDAGENSVLVEEGKIFIDDTIPEYREACKRLTDNEIEKAWKWIMQHFEGKAVSVDFVNGVLKKFDTSNQFREAQGF